MRSKYTHQHLQQEEEQQQYHHQQQQQQRSKFLPMLCSSSTKQVIIKLSHRRNSSTSSSSSSSSSAVFNEPLSPRVGCMGQVKRNNKVVGFPSGSITASTCTNNNTTTTVKSDQISNYSSNNNSIVKYHKIKRFFNTKNLTSSPTTTFAAASVARSGTHKGKITAGRNSNNNSINSNSIKRRGTRVNTKRDNHGIMISRSKFDENCAGTIASIDTKNNENDRGCLVNLIELDPPLPVVKLNLQQQQENNSVSLWKRRSGAPLKGLQLQLTQQSSTVLVQPTTV